MTNDELYYKISSRLYLNRSFMSLATALLLFAVIGKKDVVIYFWLYSLICLTESIAEYRCGLPKEKGIG